MTRGHCGSLRLQCKGYHPNISFGWSYLTVSLKTKKINGLHERDFIVTAKIDRLAQAAIGPCIGS